MKRSNQRERERGSVTRERRSTEGRRGSTVDQDDTEEIGGSSVPPSKKEKRWIQAFPHFHMTIKFL